MGDETRREDWRYFAEALAWYDGHNLTGAQVFGVVQQIRQALRDGRISPDDLGLERTVIEMGNQGWPNHRYIPAWTLPAPQVQQ